MNSIWLQQFLTFRWALVTALIVISAKLNIQIGYIPITLQVPMIVGCAAIFGAEIGVLGTLFYMLLGLFLPVFAGDTYGLDVYGGGTVGFIFMFPVVAYISGKLAYGTLNILRINAGLVLAQTVVMVGGVVGLILVKDLTFAKAFKYGFTDLALIGYGKMIITALVIWMIRR